MAAKTKLELTWIGKDNRPRLEPRIIIEEERLSHHAAARREGDHFDNILIRGDNLLALKALEASHAGEVRCIFIDPPYNTGSAFSHYDDGLEHSIWLGLMRDRLALLWTLLRQDGSIWISIDDHEAHYLKVLCDEVFGRRNYVSSIVWEKDKGRRSDAVLSSAHDYILVYAKDPETWGKRRHLLERSEGQISRYRNPDNDPRGPWLQGDNGTAKSSSEGSRWPIELPSGRMVVPPPSRGWSFGKETYEKARVEGRVYYGAKGDGMPIIKRYLSEVQTGVVPRTWWTADEAGHNQEAKRDHLNKLLKGVEPFPTPKPERLLHRILTIATDPNDLVFDSFAGSGTTGAVAHKMGRRWIMVELGDHCETHIVPRLNKVIDGEDPGGITEAIGWKGGGGYRYYKLAPSLLEKDQFDQWVISKAYNAEMLSEAMCKHFGFTYAPSANTYWMQGSSSETDFIYVTTNSLTHEQLRTISDEVGPDRTLLICCKAFQGANADTFTNLTIRKIPGAILDRCEWGKDDYSLKIEALPLIEEEPEPEAEEAPRRKSAASNQPGLFNGDGEAEA
jgi:adenine-specific DNA-methyltransferase